jgi:hypothetical protein
MLSIKLQATFVFIYAFFIERDLVRLLKQLFNKIIQS